MKTKTPTMKFEIRTPDARLTCGYQSHYYPAKDRVQPTMDYINGEWRSVARSYSWS